MLMMEIEEMDSSEKGFDDLTAISGIGPARQTFLRKSLGVHTYGDLAALSVEKIESQFRGNNQVVSRKAIENWIMEAQNLAAAKGEAKSSDAPPEAKEEKQTPDSSAAKEIVAPLDTDNSEEQKKPTPDKEGWKPFASFVVELQERVIPGKPTEYRTTVHHMEEDTGASWPGIEREKHAQWMLEQVSDRVSTRPESDEEAQPPQPAQLSVPEPVPEIKTPVKVEISQIRVLQPPKTATPAGSGKAGHAFEGSIKSRESFALEVDFDLKGESAADLTREAHVYRAQAYVQDTSTGANIQLGNTPPGTLKRDTLTYTATLPEVTLPPGVYRLFAVATLQAARTIPDFVTLPGMKVV